MNGYLIDTSVISAFGPGKSPLATGLDIWFEQEGSKGTLFIPSVTIAELQRGIARLQRKGAVARAEGLAYWLDGLLLRFAGKILPIDEAVARRAGQLDDDATANGQNPGFADVLIAATAMQHDLTVLTVNLRHFEPLGVWCWDILGFPPEIG